MTISPFLTLNDQSSLSPVFRLNCFTMLIGTVVLGDSGHAKLGAPRKGKLSSASENRRF
jgi:hypothetical protein